MAKWYYDIKETDEAMTLDELGGKGYNLSIITKLGVNVPPAFVIPTSVCKAYQANPKDVMTYIDNHVVPEIMGKLTDHFGFTPLVSVRSGAKVSMPGMMDTILNAGLDSSNMNFWEEKLGAECVADSRDRLVEMFGNVVHGIDRKLFEGKKDVARVQVFLTHADEPFPNSHKQIVDSIEAVFESWNNERAITYRNLHNISHDMGTAVVIQSMVFGNFNDKSCTGVMFTRSPSTGEDEILGEFLVNAQGEDVVAGIRTPEPIANISTWNSQIAEELLETASMLEDHYKDMQDIEFTVQDGVLYLLQTRSGKRTAEAALKIATTLYETGIIDEQTLLNRISMNQLLIYGRPTIDPTFTVEPHVKGIPASNGIVSGVAVMTSQDAINCTEPCILVTEETTPDDIGGMHAAVGILTRTGGATSHAAVVARGMDKVCVVGCTNLPSIIQGTKVTIDGSTGNVWIGTDVPVIKKDESTYLKILSNAAVKLYNVTKIITDVSELTPNGCLFPMYALEGKQNAGELLIEIVQGMDTGIIDVSQIESLWIGSDKELGIMFGDTMVKEYGLEIKARVTALCNISVKGKKIFVIGGDKYADMLHLGGFLTIPKVKTVEDLILATSGLIMKDSDLKFSGKAMAKLLQLKQLAKEDVKNFEISTGTSMVGDNIQPGTAIHGKVLLQSVLH